MSVNSQIFSTAVKSADRVMEILEYCACSARPVTHAEIGVALSIPKSSMSGLLGNLRERGYLAYRADGKSYTLGPSVVALAGRYLNTLDLPRLAQGTTQALAAATGESAALAVPVGNLVQVIARHNWVQPLMYTVQIGDTAPLHASASGKAILAFASPDTQRHMLAGYRFERTTPRSHHSLASLRADLTVARKAGVAKSDEELVVGIVSMAGPVFDGAGSVVAALSVSIPTPRVDCATHHKLGRAVMTHAAGLSRQLGATGLSMSLQGAGQSPPPTTPAKVRAAPGLALA